jgi:plastocyanin
MGTDGSQTRAVQIAVDPSTGDMAYQPGLLHANGGDQIIWTCDGATSISIQFKGISPMKGLQDVGLEDIKTGIRCFRERKDLKADKKALRGTIQDSVPPGVYPYVVCVVDVYGKVYLDASCPSVVVDP